KRRNGRRYGSRNTPSPIELLAREKKQRSSRLLRNIARPYTAMAGTENRPIRGSIPAGGDHRKRVSMYAVCIPGNMARWQEARSQRNSLRRPVHERTFVGRAHGGSIVLWPARATVTASLDDKSAQGYALQLEQRNSFQGFRLIHDHSQNV